MKHTLEIYLLEREILKTNNLERETFGKMFNFERGKTSCDSKNFREIKGLKIEKLNL